MKANLIAEVVHCGSCKLIKPLMTRVKNSAIHSFLPDLLLIWFGFKQLVPVLMMPGRNSVSNIRDSRRPEYKCSSVTGLG
jgi:hypothetical protein